MGEAAIRVSIHARVLPDQQAQEYPIGSRVESLRGESARRGSMWGIRCD